jgi:hypothetical protein
VQAEAVDVGAQGLAHRGLARRRASQGQHLLSCARSEGDAIRDRRRLQWLSACSSSSVGASASGVGWRAINAAPIHLVQHEAVQVKVEVGRRAEALDQRDGTAVAFVGLEPGSLEQMAREHALHHLQHRRDQLGLHGQQHAQRDRQRQHPLPHRYVRDDMVHQVRGGLRHPPRTARGTEPAAFAAEGQQLVVAALAAAQPQEAVGQDAALEEGVELALQAAPGQRPGPSPGTNSPQDCLCPGSALMKRGSSVPVLASVWAMKLAACCCTRRYSVVCSGRCRSQRSGAPSGAPLGLLADGLHARLPRL